MNTEDSRVGKSGVILEEPGGGLGQKESIFGCSYAFLF